MVPLACGRPDTVSNLQWQTIRDARAKDQWERRACGRSGWRAPSAHIFTNAVREYAILGVALSCHHGFQNTGLAFLRLGT